MSKDKATSIGLLRKDATRKKSSLKIESEQAIGDAFLITIQFLIDKVIGLNVLGPDETKKAIILRTATESLIGEKRIQRVRIEGHQKLINIICASMFNTKSTKENINELRRVFNQWIKVLNENEQPWRQRKPIELLE